MGSKHITIKWAKFITSADPTFIGTNIFAFACENAIAFIDLSTEEQVFYRVSGEDSGDGVSCIAGHKAYKFFAYAEMCFKPKIFIVSYPQFVTLQVISNENTYGKYIQMKFSQAEYLIALTGYPTYKLKIWNFRLGELLIEKETELASEIQVLKISSGYPLLIGQYAPELSKIIIWEAHASMEKVFLIKRQHDIPFVNRDKRISMIFGIDGIVYFTDHLGNLCSLTPSTGVIKELWECDTQTACKTDLVYYKGGFVITGYDKVIRYIKKVENNYTELWKFTMEYSVTFMGVSSNQETICILNELGAFVSIHETYEKRKEIGDLNRTVKLFDLLEPEEEYIVILTGTNELQLVEISMGVKVSEIDKILNVTCILAHPNYPIVIVGDSKCVLSIVSFYEPKYPKILTEFFLGGSPIKSLSFSPNRTHLIVGDNSGEFYVMKGLTSKMECLSHFKCEYHSFDHVAYETTAIIGILVIISKDVDSKQILTKECLIATVQKKDGHVSKNIVKLPNVYMSVAPLFTNATSAIQFFAVPFNERQIHVLELKENTFRMTSAFSTLHQLKFFKIRSSLYNIITCGLDGVVCVFNLESRHLELQYFACNRLNGRLIKACCTSNKRYCVSFTDTGCLTCIQVANYNANMTIKVAPTFESVFPHGITGYTPPEDNPGGTWLIVEKERNLHHERNKFKDMRQNVLGGFNTLKKKLQLLLDKNDEAEDLDKLETNKFNLNIEWENNVREHARLEREYEDRLLRAYIEDQNRITKWIISSTWDKMEVKSRTVRAIFSSAACENYAIVADKSNEQFYEYAKSLRITERNILPGDCLLPWIPKWASYYILSKGKPTYADDEMLNKYDDRISEIDTSEQIISTKALQLKFALSGTTTHEFIEPNELKYDQFEVVSFPQMYVQEILGRYDILELKKYFNKEFLGLMKLKEDQLKFVKDRNDRLRHILLELTILMQLKGITDISEPAPIEDPTLQSDEIPENIVKVEEHEVPTKPYISPSRQKILDEIAYQEELRRLALLADDFRERALIAMMDGVLERRWEDEIKKDIPLPDCLLNNKDPYEYTKEDLRSVQEYEEKVKVLNSEREKYHSMLVDEQARIQTELDEQILKFNTKCGETFMLKVRVDSGIRQEELKVLRTQKYCAARLAFNKLERTIIEDSQTRKSLNDELALTIEELEKLLKDCRDRYDQLQARDRLLDRQFKSQFGEFAPAFIVDQAYKIFKKRPKWPQRAWATSAILTDMANRIAHRNSVRQGLPLPEECYEFLNLIDSIENINLAPNNIDPHLWNILCRIRRHKMESEFMVKACGAQLAEAEASLNAFARELQNKKTALGSMDRDLQDLKQKYKEHIQNRYIQLVLPMGLVEIPLTGKLSDFDGCTLLNSSDVADINEIIKRAGHKKLAAMHRLAVFRRKIIFKEWEHKVYQLTLVDIRGVLQQVERCKVTIEMRDWLKRKRAGRLEDLSNAALAHEIEQKIAHLQKQLGEMDKKINEATYKVEEQKKSNSVLDKKIQSINIDVTEKNLKRDVFLEEKELRERKERMRTIVERGKLVRKVQANHAHILELATLLELQRLRTYPTLAAPKSYCS